MSRLAMVTISPECLSDMLQGKTVMETPIPSGAAIVHATYYLPTNQFKLIIEHETFDETQEGNLLPEFNPVFRTL